MGLCKFKVSSVVIKESHSYRERYENKQGDHSETSSVSPGTFGETTRLERRNNEKKKDPELKTAVRTGGHPLTAWEVVDDPK